MDKEILVDPDIDAGRQIVEALDEAGFPVVAALWNLLPEDGIWRLLIASPKVSEIGPKATYEAIQQVLVNKHIHLPLHRISAVYPNDPPIVELRIFSGTDHAPFIGSTYLQKAMLGDIYIDGAYIYRAERIIGKSGTFDLILVNFDRKRKVWTARQGKVIVKDGFFKNVEVVGGDWPQSHTKIGVNSHLYVATNPQDRDGETFGDVQRWIILGGRLRNVEIVARTVHIEGLSTAPSSSGAGI